MLEWFESTAWAQAGGAAGPAGNPLISFIPFILIFVIFYFLLVMPQQKKMKKRKAMIEALKKGDRVTTTGGIIGTVTNLSPDLSTKRLELLKEMVPAVGRVAVLWDADAPVPRLAFKQTQEAARLLGLQIQSLEVRGAKPDFETAFRGAVKSRAGALLTISNPLMRTHSAQIVDRAGKNRLPAIYADLRFVDAGGLVFYGVDDSSLYTRLAHYVDRILKGAKPADLPVEQPMKFEMVINLKAAKQIGLTIPPNVLARADRVIK